MYLFVFKNIPALQKIFVDINTTRLGGVSHARQRSIRDKKHKEDCERVAQQLLGNLGSNMTLCALIQNSLKSKLLTLAWVG